MSCILSKFLRIQFDNCTLSNRTMEVSMQFLQWQSSTNPTSFGNSLQSCFVSIRKENWNDSLEKVPNWSICGIPSFHSFSVILFSSIFSITSHLWIFIVVDFPSGCPPLPAQQSSTRNSLWLWWEEKMVTLSCGIRRKSGSVKAYLPEWKFYFLENFWSRKPVDSLTALVSAHFHRWNTPIPLSSLWNRSPGSNLRGGLEGNADY